MFTNLLPENIQQLLNSFKQRLGLATPVQEGEPEGTIPSLPFSNINFKKYLLWAGAVVLILLIIAVGVKVVVDLQNRNKPVSLTFWGLEDEKVMAPVIDKYQKDHPNIKITYVQQSLVNYRTRVQSQIQTRQGPDIFTIHASWLPMFAGDIVSVPDSLVSSKDYESVFYPSIKEAFTFKTKVYALPTEVDGLAMYVNADILKAANLSMPRLWADFRNSARAVTVKNQAGQIQTSGAALGTTNNVDFWPEILELLFLQQPKADITSPATAEGAEVLQFYTSFAKDSNKTWDASLATSTQMFTSGKLAFYFAPAREAQVIRQMNPNLPFKVAPVPQLPGTSATVGTFWGQTVSAHSSKQLAAWGFLRYLASAEALQTMYQQKMAVSGFGQPFPRVDLKPLLENDPIMGAFISQAPNYKSWYLNSDTSDSGINEEMINVFAGAVNSNLQGQEAKSSLQTITPQINQILFKYFNPGVTPAQ